MLIDSPIPEYILSANINSRNIDYLWDEKCPEINLSYKYTDEIIKRVDGVSLRGKITLSIGIFEWLVGRFNGLFDYFTPFHFIEMAWCANLDKHYASYIEFDVRKYKGPCDKAIYMGMMAVAPMLYVSENISDMNNNIDEDYDEYINEPYNIDQWKLGLRFLLSLTLHVLPSLKDFSFWLEGVVNRLIQFYSMPDDDPFSNLLGHENDKDWLGDYVPREILNLNYDYNPEQAIPLLNKFLSQVDYKNNPLLVPIDQLRKYVKAPYYIDD